MLPAQATSVLLLASGTWWSILIPAWIWWARGFETPARRKERLEEGPSRTRRLPSWVDVAQFGLPSAVTLGLAIDGLIDRRAVLGVRPWTIDFPLDDVVQLLGAGLVFVALPLLTWGAYLTAKYVYGRLEGERPLLQKGPYRYIRHPIYLAFFLLGLGWILLALNVVGFALAVLFYDVRTLRREEHDLIETYGEEYVAYQRRTGMLLPRWPRTR